MLDKPKGMSLSERIPLRHTDTDWNLARRLREPDNDGPYNVGLSEEQMVKFAELPSRQLYLLLREIEACINDPLYEPDILGPVARKVTRPFEVKGSYDSGDIEGFSENGTGRPGSKARLPTGHFRFFNRIPLIEDLGGGKGRVVAEFDLFPHTWFFREHLPGNPLMAGSSQMEAMAQLAGFFGVWILVSKDMLDGVGVYRGSSENQCCGMITPEKKLVRYEMALRYKVFPTGVMVIADGEVSADGEKTCWVKEMKAFIARG